MVDANRQVLLAQADGCTLHMEGAAPKSISIRKDTTGDNCQRYRQIKCKWGAQCKRLHDDRARGPPPDVAARAKANRENRQFRRRNNDSRDASPDCLCGEWWNFYLGPARLSWAFHIIAAICSRETITFRIARVAPRTVDFVTMAL